jgi:hypothetical protein
VAFGVAVAVFVVAPSSGACGMLPCAQVDEVHPPDGSEGVPLNAELRVLLFGSLIPYDEEGVCAPDLKRMRLLPATGEPLLLRGELLSQMQSSEGWVVAKPQAPLLPNMAYELQLEFGAGEDVCRCDGREWVTLSTFTSGDWLDDEAPTFSGVTDFTYGSRADGSNNCGSQIGMPAVPSFVPAKDDLPAPRYNLYVDGQLTRRYAAGLGSAAHPEIYIDCGWSALTTATLLLPGARLEVRAVDLAGNESAPNRALAVNANCSEPASLADAPPPPRSEASCALAAPGSRSNDWLWLFAPLLLLSRRLAGHPRKVATRAVPL